MPAHVLFEIKVSNGTRSGSGQLTVQFHEPDDATTTITPVAGPWPTQNSPSRLEQGMVTKLTWNGAPLGPCARLCYRERVTIIVEHAYRKTFRNQWFRQTNWIPATCRTTYRGDSANPNLITMNWSSPSLFDRNWVPWTYRQKNLLYNIPLNTVIARRTHQYQFDGHQCDGDPWGPFMHTVKLELRVVESVDKNGNPLPDPSLSPPQNGRVLEWFVI